MTEIVINHKNTNYHLQVQEVYSGDSVSRYELMAGAKTILLERRKTEKKFERRWKIISVNWQFKDTKAAAQFIHEIMVKIDEDVEGKKPNLSISPKT